MIFASLSSLALLSGTVLFSNAAPNPQPTSTGPIIHAVNVSNNDGGLRFHPLYIVSQPSSYYISTFCADLFLV